jgi:capsular polysaccharide biosynthesis protein
LKPFEALPALLKNKYTIILFTVLCGLAMFAVAKFIIQPVYSADASVIINKTADSSGDGETYDDLLMTSRLVTTYSYILTSDTVLDHVRADLNLGVTTDALRDEVKISGMGDTEILIISVSDANARRAAEIAHDIADIATNRLPVSSPDIKLQQIDTAAAPANPNSPDVVKYTILGLLAGFLCTTIIFVILFYADNTIKTEEDIRLCDLNLLAVIPRLGRDSSNAKSPYGEPK